MELSNNQMIIVKLITIFGVVPQIQHSGLIQSMVASAYFLQHFCLASTISQMILNRLSMMLDCKFGN
jgi:hypothetical protein